MNNAVYQIASFMIMRNSATWRWSHARHHSETYFVGRDPEIAVMRPPELAKLILNFFGVLDVLKFLPNLKLVKMKLVNQNQVKLKLVSLKLVKLKKLNQKRLVK